MSRKKVIRLEYSPVQKALNVFVFEYDLDSHTRELLSWPTENWGEPLGIVSVAEGVQTDPSFRIGQDQAQELFNDLWRAGFRPDFHEPESYRNDHLEDLQEILHKVLPRALRKEE